LAAVYLYTFNTRSCFQFAVIQDVTAPCLTEVDWVIMTVIAIGAGAVIWEERVSVLGFVLAHIIATMIFITALVLPPLLAGADVAILSLVLAQAVSLTFNYEFPFSIFFSFLGTFVGMYIGGKLPEKQLEF